MSKNGNIKVFLAHGFDKRERAGSISEANLAKHFVSALRRRGFDVLTGEPPEAENIDQKIKKRIDDADVVLGLFSRRWQIVPFDAPPNSIKENRFVCPPFVLSECSYALGSHQATMDVPKLVGGFAEHGIHATDLALITAGGREVVFFDSSDLQSKETVAKIDIYLDSIRHRLGRARQKDNLFEPASYRQITLSKSVYVHRSGLGIFRNRYKVTIPDATEFAKGDGRIAHTLHTDKPNKLPPFGVMSATSFERRFEAPFFAAEGFAINKKRFDANNFKVVEGDRVGEQIAFYVEFGPLPSGRNTIEYEYTWGVPDLFARREQLKQGENNEVSLRAFHGRIDHAALRVVFERSGADRRADLFDVKPFYQLSTRANSPTFGSKKPLESADRTVCEEIYDWEHEQFDGCIRISWRPSS